MSDQKRERCDNCEGGLSVVTWACHHLDGTPANDQCARPQLVEVKGCLGCVGRFSRHGRASALICEWWQDGESPDLAPWIHARKKHGIAPPDCPARKGVLVKVAP